MSSTDSLKDIPSSDTGAVISAPITKRSDDYSMSEKEYINLFNRMEEHLSQEIIDEIYPYVLTEKSDAGFPVINLKSAKILSEISQRLHRREMKLGETHLKWRKTASGALGRMNPIMFELNTSSASELYDNAVPAHLSKIQRIIITEIPTLSQLKKISAVRTSSYKLPFRNVTGLSFGRGQFRRSDGTPWDMDVDAGDNILMDNEASLVRQSWLSAGDVFTHSQTFGARRKSMHVCFTEQHTDGPGSFTLNSRNWQYIVPFYLQFGTLTVHGFRVFDDLIPYSKTNHMILPNGFLICSSIDPTPEGTSPQDMYRALLRSLTPPPGIASEPRTLTISAPGILDAETRRKIYRDILTMSREERELSALSDEQLNSRLEEINEDGSLAITIDSRGSAILADPREYKSCVCCMSVKGVRSKEEWDEIEAARKSASAA